MATNDVWLYQGEANPNDVRLRTVPPVTNYVLTADPGTYALTGTASTLKYNRVVVAAGGTYALSGTAATLKFNRLVVASGGSYALSGTAATLKFNRIVVASGGTYALSGTAATLKLNRVLIASGGGYTLSGSPASLLYGRSLDATGGTYSITGSPATFTYTPIPLGSSGGTPAIWDEDEERRRYPPVPQNPQDRSALDRELALMLGHHALPTPALRQPVPARVTALHPDLDMAMVLMLIAVADDDT